MTRLNIPTAAPDVLPPGRSLTARALEAQSELLPYALAFFAIALPVFVWAGTYAADSAWMSAIFIQFSFNWAAFYGVVNTLKARRETALADDRRGMMHIAGGLLWALAVGEIALFGLHAGAVRESILAMATAGAVACMFFASPYLKALLIVGPAAAAGPLVALFASGDRASSTPAAACGALALAMALCMIVNRILRRQFDLAVEREALVADRADSLGEAERLARSKSHILATLSHEIRNGLTGVAHVLAAAAGTGGRAAPSRDQLSAALTAAQELLEVLNATLDTETASAGRLVLATRPFDPSRLIRSTVLLGRPKAAAKGLELDIQLDAAVSSGAALGDPARVRQILSNLIGNAVKYTARGRVEVRVHRIGTDRLRFEVADTGPGLSDEELQQAFEPFTRIERVGLGVPGAGLGLSLSRELARLMGGRLEAESAVGVGSRFWFDLPFDETARPQHEPDEAEDLSGQGAVAAPRSLRVLVAEDDALNAAMLRAILEQLGHQVVHAHDGRRALELADFCQFDLIMLDGRTPQLATPGAVGQIRASTSATREAPIIAVIDGDGEEGQACMAAGVDQVLRRPVTVSSVARAVAASVSAEREPPRKPALSKRLRAVAG